MGRIRFIVLGPTDRKRKDGTLRRTSAIAKSVHAFSLSDQAHALKVAHRRIIHATQERPSEDHPYMPLACSSGGALSIEWIATMR